MDGWICAVVAKVEGNVFPSRARARFVSQVVSHGKSAQVSEVPGLWGLHAAFEQSMVLFVL